MAQRKRDTSNFLDLKQQITYLDYPLSTSVIYSMVELYQTPKELYQVNVKSEHWGTSHPLPKTFAQTEIQDSYVSLVL